MADKKHKKRLRPWVVTTLGVVAATLISVVGIKMIPSKTVHADGDDDANSTVTITYDANGGTYDDGSTTNAVQYTKADPNAVIKYSHTANIADDGTVSGAYASNLNTNDVITIDGASKLYIDVWYATMYYYYDWLAIYPSGVTPSRDNYSQATISSGQLGGGGTGTSPSQPIPARPDDEANHKTYTVDGDTAQFFFTSAQWGGGSYGYYAVISDKPIAGIIVNGVEDKPTKDGYKVASWNTAADGSGTSYASFSDVPYTNDLTLYAQWEEHPWYEDWKYNLRTDQGNNCIFISSYTGDETKYKVPSKATIDGVEYQTYLGDGNRSGIDTGTIKNLSFEDGIAPLSSNSEHLFNRNSDSSIKLETIDASNLDFSNVTETDYMFDYCSKLKEVIFPNTPDLFSRVTSAIRMFYGCEKLASLDTSNWNLNSLTNGSNMFTRCFSLTTLDTSNWELDSLTDGQSMFSACQKLASLNTSDWNLGSLTDASNMFHGCSSLSSLDTSSWNLNNLTNGSGMFYECKKLASLDTSNWNLNSLTDASYMFTRCSSLTTLDTSNWELDSLTDGQSMFSGCQKLASLNTSDWNLGSLTDGQSMFSGCQKLASLNTSDWNLGSLTNGSEMFNRCSSLTNLDLSDCSVNALTNAQQMFSYCSALTTLNLSSVSTKSIVLRTSYRAPSYALQRMFDGDYSLRSVTFGPDFSLKGNDTITDTQYMAILPSDSINGYTGKWTRNDPNNHADAVTAEYLRDNYDPATMAGTWVREKVPSVTLPIRFTYEGQEVDDFEDYVSISIQDSTNYTAVTKTAVKSSDGSKTTGYTVELEPGKSYKANLSLTKKDKYDLDSSYRYNSYSSDTKPINITVDSSGKVTGDSINADGNLQIKLVYGGIKIPIRFRSIDGQIVYPDYDQLVYYGANGTDVIKKTVNPVFEHIWNADSYTPGSDLGYLTVEGLGSKYEPVRIYLGFYTSEISSKLDSDGYVTIDLKPKMEYGPALPEAGDRGAMLITIVGCIGIAAVVIYMSSRKKKSEDSDDDSDDE